VVQNTVNENISGTVGVLTKTNEDALTLNTLFNKSGIPSRIIQSDTGFNLWNLVEIRYFDSLLNKTENGIIIEEETWDAAILSLKEQYGQSTNLKGVIKLLNDFKKTNQRLFYSDFKQTISESEQKDFYETSS
jgi:ATP-dependent DNA helicase RecQ